MSFLFFPPIVAHQSGRGSGAEVDSTERWRKKETDRKRRQRQKLKLEREDSNAYLALEGSRMLLEHQDKERKDLQQDASQVRKYEGRSQKNFLKSGEKVRDVVSRTIKKVSRASSHVLNRSAKTPPVQHLDAAPHSSDVAGRTESEVDSSYFNDSAAEDSIADSSQLPVLEDEEDSDAEESFAESSRLSVIFEDSDAEESIAKSSRSPIILEEPHVEDVGVKASTADSSRFRKNAVVECKGASVAWASPSRRASPKCRNPIALPLTTERREITFNMEEDTALSTQGSKLCQEAIEVYVPGIQPKDGLGGVLGQVQGRLHPERMKDLWYIQRGRVKVQHDKWESQLTDRDKYERRLRRVLGALCPNWHLHHYNGGAESLRERNHALEREIATPRRQHGHDKRGRDSEWDDFESRPVKRSRFLDDERFFL